MTYVSKLTTQDTGPVTESTVLASLEKLNQPEWIELLDDTLRRKVSVMPVLMPNRGDDLLDYLRAQIAKLGVATQKLVGSALNTNLNDYLREKNNDLISDALIFVAASPIGFNAYALFEIALDNTRTIDSRIQAGKALASYASRALQTSGAIDQFLNIDLKSHPHLASAVVSILTSNDGPKKAIEALVCLTKKPDNIERPLRNAIQMILRRDTGRDDIQKFCSEAPNWLKSYLKKFRDSVVADSIPGRIENEDDKYLISEIIEKNGKDMHLVVVNPNIYKNDFKGFLIRGLQAASRIEEAHKPSGLYWHQVNAIKTCAVQRGLSRLQAVTMPYPGIYEKLFRKGHRTISSLMDLQQGRVLDGIENRTEEFCQALIEQSLTTEQKQQVTRVAPDMSKAYRNSVEEKLPQMDIINEGVGKVRRQENEALKFGRWQNLTDWSTKSTSMKPYAHIRKANAARQENLKNLLSSSHFLLLPTREEYYGVVFAEDCAFGTPVITTDTDGVRTAIKKWLFAEECENPYTSPIRRTVMLESAQSPWKSKTTIASY